MKKLIFVMPLMALSLLANCNKNSNQFSMNDEVCSSYLSAPTSKEQFNIIYNNVSSRTKVNHDVAIPYIINCKPDGGNEYTYHVANNPTFDNESITTMIVPQFAIDNLIPGETYYWKVYGSKSTNPLKSGSFKVNDKNVRWINATSVGNLRDLGGWKLSNGKKIKFGQVYRGRHLDCLNGDDEKVLKGTLGIKSEIDLRKDKDGGRPGQGPHVADMTGYYFYNNDLQYNNAITEVNNPLEGVCINPNSDLNGKTLTGTQMFKDIFETLADKNKLPVYFHCSGGADRTGTLAFLIEGLLGVSEEDLTRDYELTTFNLGTIGGRLRRDPNANYTDFDYSKDYYAVPESASGMKTRWPLLIKEIKKIDNDISLGVEKFLKEKCEVSSETINQVKANLTE